jgi:stage II sporulation protein GA (sporulation sigma-E factor processing peptidase)
MKTVYADVVWLINFAMDFVILLVTGWMAKKKTKRWRLLTGAAIGASYSLLLIFPVAATTIVSLFAKLLFSCLMVLIVFGPQNVVEFLRFWGLFYLASFLLGGAAYGINSLFYDTQLLGGMVFTSGKPAWIPNIGVSLVALSVPVVYVLGRTTWNRMERWKLRDANLWNVSVVIDGQSVRFAGLLDTGNALTDPLTRLPVAVVEWEAVAAILPEVLHQPYRGQRDPTLELAELELDERWQSRFRIVPYRGVGGSMGMLLAFRPAEMVLEQNESRLTVDRILIALNPKPLSSDNTYQAILPPACLSEESISKPLNADLLGRKESTAG